MREPAILETGSLPLIEGDRIGLFLLGILVCSVISPVIVQIMEICIEYKKRREEEGRRNSYYLGKIKRVGAPKIERLVSKDGLLIGIKYKNKAFREQNHEIIDLNREIKDIRTKTLCVCRHMSYLIHIKMVEVTEQEKQGAGRSSPKGKGFEDKTELIARFNGDPSVTNLDKLPRVARPERPIFISTKEKFGQTLRKAFAKMKVGEYKSLLLTSCEHTMHLFVKWKKSDKDQPERLVLSFYDPNKSNLDERLVIRVGSKDDLKELEDLELSHLMTESQISYNGCDKVIGLADLTPSETDKGLVRVNNNMQPDFEQFVSPKSLVDALMLCWMADDGCIFYEKSLVSKHLEYLLSKPQLQTAEGRALLITALNSHSQYFNDDSNSMATMTGWGLVAKLTPDLLGQCLRLVKLADDKELYMNFLFSDPTGGELGWSIMAQIAPKKFGEFLGEITTQRNKNRLAWKLTLIMDPDGNTPLHKIARHAPDQLNTCIDIIYNSICSEKRPDLSTDLGKRLFKYLEIHLAGNSSDPVIRKRRYRKAKTLLAYINDQFIGQTSRAELGKNENKIFSLLKPKGAILLKDLEAHYTKKKITEKGGGKLLLLKYLDHYIISFCLPHRSNAKHASRGLNFFGRQRYIHITEILSNKVDDRETKLAAARLLKRIIENIENRETYMYSYPLAGNLQTMNLDLVKAMKSGKLGDIFKKMKTHLSELEVKKVEQTISTLNPPRIGCTAF